MKQFFRKIFVKEIDGIDGPVPQPGEGIRKKHHHANEVALTSGDSQMPLQYDFLPPNKSIRLLELAPGKWDEPVRCFLRTTRLDAEDLSYEAVSYAWGDPTARKNIFCNDSLISITRSLFEALQRFRKVNATRILWADAICINQNDTEERTSQVRLMGLIYSKALRVLVWLQHDDRHAIRTALDAICHYVLHHTPEVRSGRLLYGWHDTVATTLKGKYRSDSTNSAIAAMVRLCSSPWFSRGWIIQEVALCTSALLFWGPAEIDFHWISAASFVAFQNDHINIFLHPSHRPVTHCAIINILRSYAHGSDVVVSFYNLLQNTRNFKFSDPKDRVYGLLGLPTVECNPHNGYTLITPDYGISTRECYRRLSARLLLEGKDLRVLSSVQHGTTLPSEWSSWAPAWDMKEHSIFANVKEEVSIENRLHALVEESDKVHGARECVCITGFRIELVKGLLVGTERLQNLGNSLEMTRAQIMLHQLEIAYGSTYVAWTFGNDNKGLPLDREHLDLRLNDYEAFMNWNDFRTHVALKDSRSPNKRVKCAESDAVRFMNAFASTMRGRIPFLLDSGMICIAPQATLPNDVIVALHGATVPFVLRIAEGGLWRLVGECYIFDFLEGRVTQEWEEKGSLSEKFHIY